ncbi:MAG: tRNA guanosine(34) transglycosylase Tgt [Leptospira sp.]|nr:tRNA guanosine(34) transglycosylase Tgt [Leptospira sp.]
MIFKETHQSSESYARTGILSTKGKEVETPVFMPVGTQATIKSLSTEDINELGYNLILANTYHLYLRPGIEVLDHFSGAKNFMGYEGLMLTDSGGYQMFSLSSLFKFEQDGVKFQSHIDGSHHKFTPEKVLDIQNSIGSDIWMVLDDCAPFDSDAKRIRESLERTHRWAKQSIEYREKMNADSHVFGISQGSMDLAARKISLEYIQSLPFSGIAVGGLSVGEPRNLFYQVLEHLAPFHDPKRPRYLMGVGTVPDILEGVKNGIDMFDCVLPTRNARNAQVFTRKGRLNLRNEIHKLSDKPIDEECNCKVCKNYSVGYLRHLHKSKEILALSLSTYHNLHFMKDFMEMLRNSIKLGEFNVFYNKWKNLYKTLN